MSVVSAPVRSAPVLDIDPFNVANLIDWLPIDRAIREAGPVAYLPQYDLWAVGGYDTVQNIFRDWENFSSASGTGLTNVRKAQAWRKPSPILEVDPPQHTRARTVLARILSPGAINKLREAFRSEAEKVVETVVAKGTFDAVPELIESFIFKVMPDAIGLPAEGRENLLPYANLNFNAAGPRNELYDKALAAAGDSPQWVADQCQADRLRPGSFGAQIFDAASAGDLDAEDAPLLVRSFLTASLDTTIYGIGLALHAFATNPEQWDILRGKPEAARSAFDEVLRFNAPSPYIARTTTRDIVVEGVEIPAESKVLLCLGAANRDPRRWPDPDKFDLTRRTAGQMSFGTGIHGCVGQVVARLEAEVVLNALATRVDRIELAAQPVWRPTNWLRGLSSLPLTVHRKA